MTNKDKISDIDDFQNSNTYNTSDDSDDIKFTDLSLIHISEPTRH